MDICVLLILPNISLAVINNYVSNWRYQTNGLSRNNYNLVMHASEYYVYLQKFNDTIIINIWISYLGCIGPVNEDEIESSA